MEICYFLIHFDDLSIGFVSLSKVIGVHKIVCNMLIGRENEMATLGGLISSDESQFVAF